ncbi:sugar transferase [Gordonibacter sp. 28C]|uniref:sugar transferase n=1 Tax=Gordonibacter sp. 28C TaxID=2078569 RepID=UPI000DF78077|nr:sugar transferase [Gordonibacter sp. 28C]RDB63926.1 sugar transferase [Gordonibacter sp. 28C]
MLRDELTKAQRWEIADALAADRLPSINSKLEDVHPSTTFYARYGKRAVDIIVSGIALIATLPVNLVIGVVTFFDLGRPIFFKQRRVGRNAELFTIIKFRNMRNTTDENGELFPSKDRVTKFGKFVRKTSLDELLNFWSVFKGDMSIIGPRPLVPEYVGRYNKRHRMRLAVRPGLECPPRELPDHVWTWQEQLDNDVWYVENVSFKVDCRMFANLVRFALDSKSANARSTSKRGTFMGYDENGSAINLDGVPVEYAEKILSGSR